MQILGAHDSLCIGQQASLYLYKGTEGFDWENDGRWSESREIAGS
jgi:hypothetical protein